MYSEAVRSLESNHSNLHEDLPRVDLIKRVVRHKEAFVSHYGALSTVTPSHSTGRSPKDTMIVLREENKHHIDWESPNCIAFDAKAFDIVVEQALLALMKSDEIYVTNKVVGAESKYALPVKTITNFALSALFTDNMFRSIPSDISSSVFADREFTLIALPYEKLDQSKYSSLVSPEVQLRKSGMAVLMDFEKRIGVVYGSAYLGSVKKLMFTVMNYLLIDEGVLPMHCAANEGDDGKSALFFGLSGTGKTTLSTDSTRHLIGDDEHLWSENGVSNMEGGCYAKLINLRQDKEPDIYNAVFSDREAHQNGAIVENAFMAPDGKFDLNDERLTPNSRASYPLAFLPQVKDSAMGGIPETIIFLTADASGVLPPISRLSKNQAMIWFLMGYTSKLAGTETGVTEPVPTFSRFFGEPFMPRNPDEYMKLFGENIEKYGSEVYLVNTGWSGGGYGVGQRMDISFTRSMIRAALDGKLRDVEYRENNLFHLSVPMSCPDVPTDVLTPKNTWSDKQAYDKAATKLAQAFASYFDKIYSHKNIASDIASECPGK